MQSFVINVKKKAEALLKSEDDGPAAQNPAPEGATGATESPAGGGEDAGADDGQTLEQRLVEAMRTIYDPEIPVNIYDLGLIYHIDANEAEGVVYVEMTLTAPGCPVAQTFPGMVESRLQEVPGVEEVTVKLVWDPPWTQDRMSEAARLQLGMF